jgi:hypothetical protein
MGFRYQLATADGEVFDEREWAYLPQPGDELILSGNRRVRVTAVLPEATVAEFVDQPGLRAPGHTSSTCGISDTDPSCARCTLAQTCHGRSSSRATLGFATLT